MIGNQLFFAVSRKSIQNMVIQQKRSQSSFVACNIYVSAGPDHDKTINDAKRSLLVNILQDAQTKCKCLTAKNPTCGKVVMVHAYTDKAYDRTSYHLAGTIESVVDVASSIAIDAINGISKMKFGMRIKQNEYQHPAVGIVDHISVMPLGSDDKKDTTGLAAVAIGKVLTENGVHVIPYGSADTQNTPLAVVRKTKTSFFTSSSGRLVKDRNLRIGVCTVGSPPSFVENLNIRLKRSVSRKQAIALTAMLRERDGGIDGVEALTLPYTNGRHEVACNILRPSQSTLDDIMTKIDEWSTQLSKDDNKNFKTVRSDYVEMAYRVGTTSTECLDVLEMEKSQYDQHELNLVETFNAYFNNESMAFE